jgi:hypothetical protein
MTRRPKSLRLSSTLGLVLLTAACETPLMVPSASAATTSGLFESATPAAAPGERCTYADAQSLFNNFSSAFALRARGPSPSSPVDAVTNCQYRLFFDGATFTFAQQDVFLGGINLSWDVETAGLLGITREEAIADLEATETRVWLARVESDGTVGALVEQPLLRTPYKDGVHPALGRVVQQHRAYITSLPAGEHLSIFEMTWQEFHGLPAGEFQATVHLVITP